MLAEGTQTSPALIEVFDLTSTNDGVPDQLRDLATGLRSRLVGLKPDRVVVRRADIPPKPSKHEGPRLRLLAEGALTAAARDEVGDVLIGTGKELAARVPMKKAALEAHAEAALSGAPVEAAAAALAGLS